MDIEKILKKLDWLDDERRKDKIIISTLEERIKLLDSQIVILSQENKELSSQATRSAAMNAKFDQFQSAMAKMQVDFNRSIEAVDKQRLDQAREVEKQHRADLEGIQKSIGDVKKNIEAINDLKKGLQTRIDEEVRLTRAVKELEDRITENQRADEESRRILKIADEGRRQDTKRIMDTQGEVAALRKRYDEMRGKLDVNIDSLQKIEARLNEILNAEVERRQAQSAFMERHNLQALERDRVWKEWLEKINDFSQQNVNFDAQIQAMDAAQRSVKRSQENFEDMTKKFDRRINEITEMQRLGEERFRQDWISFKADDQKRWSNYTLAQDEQRRDVERINEKNNQRLLDLENLNSDLQDLMGQVNTETQKRMQDILPIIQRWIQDYDVIMRQKQGS